MLVKKGGFGGASKGCANFSISPFVALSQNGAFFIIRGANFPLISVL